MKIGHYFNKYGDIFYIFVENIKPHTMVEINKRVKKIRSDKMGYKVFDEADGTEVNQDLIPLYMEVDTNQVSYNYKKYVYANTIDLSMLGNNNIGLQNLGLLLFLSCNLKPIYNICMADEEKAHTAKSIAKALSYSENHIKRNLNELEELGVIVYRKIPGHESLGKVYIINPMYIKNGKNTSKIIPTFFHKPSSNKENNSRSSVLEEIKNNLSKAENWNKQKLE